MRIYVFIFIINLLISSTGYALDCKKPIDKPDMVSQYNLAEYYFVGNCTKANYKKAEQYYLNSAKQGHGSSALRLGFLYAEDHFFGVKTDYILAEKWFKIAANKNAGDGKFRLGNFYHNYKRPKDYILAEKWLKEAAEQGHKIAQYDLANFYKTGKSNIKKDLKKSYFWMEKAGKQSLLHAQIEMVKAYQTGDYLKKDELKSLSWALKITSNKNPPVYWLNYVGDIFYNGDGRVSKNLKQAKKYYQRAAKKHNQYAKEQLKKME